jgi:hypothetical protein|tara:strand:- start:322 stop:561 length:240 start_codon:yes stop_codon:yes gene_type:complete
MDEFVLTNFLETAFGEDARFAETEISSLVQTIDQLLSNYKDSEVDRGEVSQLLFKLISELSKTITTPSDESDTVSEVSE